MSDKNKENYEKSPASTLIHLLDTRLSQLFLLIFGTVLLGTFLFLSYREDPDSMLTLVALIGLVLYVTLSVTLFLVLSYRRSVIEEQELSAEEMNTEIYDVFRHMIHLPYAVIDANGKVKVVNRALQTILRLNSPVCNMPLSALFTQPGFSEIIRSTGDTPLSRNPRILDERGNIIPTAHGFSATLAGRQYEIFSYGIRMRESDYYFLTFSDVTDYKILKQKLESEAPVVAYVVLDNLEELAQYVRVSYRSAANEIEALLRNWANEMQGFLREYDRDKFILLFSAESLHNCIDNNFAILDRIRQVKLGDNSFPVTVSMGIAATGSTYAQREAAASSALEMALQRGGDQVIVKRVEGISVYGGRVKIMQGNTSIISRVNSNQLCSLALQAGNVLIMGHRNPDFDAIGSCVGLSRLVRSALAAAGSETDVRIIVNRECENFRVAATHIEDDSPLKDLFIDPHNALDLVRSDTLLIVADVNKLAITEAPDVMRSVTNIAIIDHHRQYEVFDFAPSLSFIHPTASSASELVSEMLEQSPFADRLTKEEATLMLAGIMLDTKNFTHSTSAQTFSVVNYLYRQGAHTNVSRLFFYETVDELLAASYFGANTNIYRKRIAITWYDVEKTAGDEGAPVCDPRTAASRAADRLLTVKGIDAAFALVAFGNSISISARSDDKINVQLIMEKLGGGGHYDMAGAQVKDTLLFDAAEKLRNAIDDYLDSDTQNVL